MSTSNATRPPTFLPDVDPIDASSYPDPPFVSDIDESFLSSYLSVTHHSNSPSPPLQDTPAQFSSQTSGHSEYGSFDVDNDQPFGIDLGSFHDSDLLDGSIFNATEGAAFSADASCPLGIPATGGSPTDEQEHTTMPRDIGKQRRSPQLGRRNTPSISISTNVEYQHPRTVGVTMGRTNSGDSTDGNGVMQSSPMLTVNGNPWDSNEGHDLSPATSLRQVIDSHPGPQEHNYFGQSVPPNAHQGAVSSMVAYDGSDDAAENEGRGRRGISPGQRENIAQAEIPNLKEQDIARQASETVEDWMEKEVGAQDSGTATYAAQNGLHAPRGKHIRSASTGDMSRLLHNDDMDDKAWFEGPKTPFEDNTIRPVSPTASIRLNQLKEGQIYINPRAVGTTVTADDLHLLRASAHLSGTPFYRDNQQSGGEHNGTSANDHIKKWKVDFDNSSLLSRRATWGTTRQSAPSVSEMDSVGNIFKRLSISENKDKLINLVRKKSTGSSSKLKRNRSDAGASVRSPSWLHQHQDDASSLAPPLTPGLNRSRPQSPSRLQTSFGKSLAPDYGLSHSRRASLSATSTPGSSGGLLGKAKDALRRSRSKSDLPRGTGSALSGLLRRHGGMPVVNLASPLIDADDDPPPVHASSDGEGEDDEHVDYRDDDLAPNFNIEVVTSREGFRNYILQLTPDIPAFLLERLAYHQEQRFKELLNRRIHHHHEVLVGACASGDVCIAMGGSAKKLEEKPKGRDASSSRQHAVDDDSDSNPENKLRPDMFPAGIPPPVAERFPARIECHLCFQVKELLKPSDWTKHVYEDIGPYSCTYDGCTNDPKSFKRKADWVRHEDELHRRFKVWRCDINGCGHECHRKNNFLQHLVREHNMQDPTKRSKRDIKNATGKDRETWDAVDRCFRDNTQSPEGQPCIFCGKTFGTWKKATGHVALHMEAISLPTTKMVEQHEIIEGTVISPVETPFAQHPMAGQQFLSPADMPRNVSAASHGYDILQQPAFPQSFHTQSGHGNMYDTNEMSRQLGQNEIGLQRQVGTPSTSMNSRMASASPMQMGTPFSSVSYGPRRAQHNLGWNSGGQPPQCPNPAYLPFSTPTSCDESAYSLSPNSAVGHPTTSAPLLGLALTSEEMSMGTASYSFGGNDTQMYDLPGSNANTLGVGDGFNVGINESPDDAFNNNGWTDPATSMSMGGRNGQYQTIGAACPFQSDLGNGMRNLGAQHMDNCHAPQMQQPRQAAQPAWCSMSMNNGRTTSTPTRPHPQGSFPQQLYRQQGFPGNMKFGY